MGLDTRRLLTWIAGIALAFALLLLSVQWLAFDEAFYYTHLEKHESYSRFESREVVDATVTGLLDFFRGELENPPELLGEAESSHLVDVKLLLDRTRVVCVALLCIFTANIIRAARACEKQRKRLVVVSSYLHYGGIATLGLCLLLAVAALFFQPMFILFHNVFFPQGNWLFPMDSTLIMLFPRGFFFDLFVAVIVRTALLGLSALMLGHIVQKSICWLSSRGARSAS